LTLAAAALLLSAGVGLIVTASTPAAGVTLDGFSASDADATVDGGIDTADVDATVTYQHDATDAEMAAVKLVVGPSEGDTERIGSVVERDPTTGERTIEVSGDLLDAYAEGDLLPPAGETRTTEVVVGVGLEVTRENGETIERWQYDTATLTVTDAGTVTASIGGDATITIDG